jgi:TetR/AcrR family transcriptional regulator, ethionamide resistance regulator
VGSASRGSRLEKNPFRELTVERVIARTEPLRPVFYAYSGDRYSLVARILEGIGGLLFAVDRRWLVGAQDENDPLALRPVLRVIADAASQDAKIEEV